MTSKAQQMTEISSTVVYYYSFRSYKVLSLYYCLSHTLRSNAFYQLIPFFVSSLFFFFVSNAFYQLIPLFFGVQRILSTHPFFCLIPFFFFLVSNAFYQLIPLFVSSLFFFFFFLVSNTFYQLILLFVSSFFFFFFFFFFFGVQRILSTHPSFCLINFFFFFFFFFFLCPTHFINSSLFFIPSSPRPVVRRKVQRMARHRVSGNPLKSAAALEQAHYTQTRLHAGERELRDNKVKESKPFIYH